jgi:chromosome segregation ATPase
MEETINRQRTEMNSEAEQTKKTANELDTLRIKYTTHKERADQDKKEFLRLREQFVQLRDSLVNKDRINKDLQKRVEQLESDLFQKSQQVQNFKKLTPRLNLCNASLNQIPTRYQKNLNNKKKPYSNCNQL